MVNTIRFLASGQWPEALGLLGLTLGLGLGAAALGFGLGRTLKGPAATR